MANPAGAAAAGEKNWMPIESNPEVMTAYARQLGLPEEWAFYDLLSSEQWAIDMVPSPVIAALMLFPIKEASEAAAAEEAARIARDGQPAFSGYFCKQYIPNACGTIGLLHAVANTAAAAGGPLELPGDSWYARFLARTAARSPGERGHDLEADTEGEAAHAAVVELGQSDVVDDTNQHFIAFVRAGGRLWELDGRKDTPVDHGACDADGEGGLLPVACRVMRAFMARDPGELRFTMVALAPALPPEED